VPWGVNEVQDVRDTIFLVVHPGGLHFDRNSSLSLEFHRVEYLSLHFARLNGIGFFEHAVRQRALAVIDVCDDTKIAYVL
jgi:hypothetical protein